MTGNCDTGSAFDTRAGATGIGIVGIVAITIGVDPAVETDVDTAGIGIVDIEAIIIGPAGVSTMILTGIVMTDGAIIKGCGIGRPPYKTLSPVAREGLKFCGLFITGLLGVIGILGVIFAVTVGAPTRERL